MQRRAAAARVLDATSNALDVINVRTSKEAVTDYSPEALETIVSAFNDRVLQAIHQDPNGSLTQNFFQSLRHPGLLRTHLDLRD